MPARRCATTATYALDRRYRRIRQRHEHGASPDRGDRAWRGDRRHPGSAIGHDNGGHDTGAYGSTGTIVAGRATQLACEALREQILDFAVEYAGGARAAWSLVDGAVSRPGQQVGLAELAAAACAKGRRLAAMGRSDGSPRSVAFNVQAFRVAVNKTHRRDQDPAQRPRGGCGSRHQSNAMPRPGRRRRRAIARRHALRGNGDRRTPAA